jgi:hypothetical protein
MHLKIGSEYDCKVFKKPLSQLRGELKICRSGSAGHRPTVMKMESFQDFGLPAQDTGVHESI